MYLPPHKAHSHLVHIPILIPHSFTYKSRAHPIQTIPPDTAWTMARWSHRYQGYFQPTSLLSTPISTHPSQYLPVVIHPLYDLSLLWLNAAIYRYIEPSATPISNTSSLIVFNIYPIFASQGWNLRISNELHYTHVRCNVHTTVRYITSHYSNLLSEPTTNPPLIHTANLY